MFAVRQQVVTLRLQTRLQKIVDRLHVLEGLLIAYLNLDAVIAVIRQADEPKQQLQQRFELTQRQAEAILEIRLRQLAKLEEIRINKEQRDLNKERQELEATLNSPLKLRNLIRRELQAVADKHVMLVAVFYKVPMLPRH